MNFRLAACEQHQSPTLSRRVLLMHTPSSVAEELAMIPSSSELTGADVGLCALIYFYVKSEPHNHTGPHLSRLLSFALRLIFRVDPPYAKARDLLAALEAFMLAETGSSRDALGEVPVHEVLDELRDIIEEARTFSGLHNYFTRIERLLLREEMYDDLENKTIGPPERQIDESSPFGHYLHQCLETYLSLEDDAFVKLVRRVDVWAAQQDDEGAVHEANELSADEELVLAVRRGDYATARAGLEGSFDRAPSAIMGRTLPETLLHYATFHAKTNGYETAKASLEEALRLARGNNDVACIAACDDLLRQIVFEEESATPRRATARPRGASSAIIVTHKRDALRHIDDGAPLIHVAQAIGRHEKDMRKRTMGGVLNDATEEGGMDVEAAFDYDLMQSEIWRNVGSKYNSDVLQHACAEEATQAYGWTAREMALTLALSKAASASASDRHAEALALLLDDELIASMDMGMLYRWHAEALRCVYRAALQANATATMREVQRLRPEVIREVGGDAIGQTDRNTATRIPHSEATFARSMRLSKAQLLRQELDEASRARRTAGNGAQAMLMSVQVMDEAQRAHLFPLYRRAACEAAEAFLSLGQTQRARALLEDVLAQAMTDAEAEVRACTAWAYARVLLAEQQEDAYERALPWLDRASTNFKEACMWPALCEALFAKARILHHLGRIEKRDAAAEAHNAAQKESKSIVETPVRILEQVQHIAGLASARVVAGG